jgi:hypothetical protein
VSYSDAADRVQCDVSAVTLQGRVTAVLHGMGDGDAEVVCVLQSLVVQEFVGRFFGGRIMKIE